MNSGQIGFNYNSRAARAARQARFFASDGAILMLNLFIFLCVVAGVAVFIMDDKAWMLIAAITAVAFILRTYFSGNLANIQGDINKQSGQNQLEEMLDVRTLGKLKNINSRRDIWQAVHGNWRQRFITTRYGISEGYIEANLPEGKEDTSALLQAARELALAEGQPQITSASLTVALISSIPGYEQHLAERHVEPVDLVAGIDWQRHIEASIKQADEFKFGGGLTKGSTGGFTPALNRLGKDLTYEVSSKEFLYRSFDMHAAQVDQAINSLSRSDHSSIAVIGPAGSGKESVVKALALALYAGKKVPKNLSFSRVFQVNASSLISAVSQTANAEQIFNSLVNEAARAKNIILHFNNTQDFFAQHEAVGSANFSGLINTLAANPPLPVIFSMNDLAWQRIKQDYPALANNINQIHISEPSEQEVMRVLEDQAPIIESKTNSVFTYQSICEAYRLAGRYMSDTAFPGKGLQAMRAAANFAKGGLITEEIMRQSFEANFSVKLEASDQDKSALLDLESTLKKRMVGQSRAIQVVSDAMRRSASGLGQANRPVGTFLFIGPTGVGKTELAKSLADAYFGGEDKVIRVDMNQYLSTSDLPRMIDKTQPDSLVAKVARQPFSVILLDEIEKAHQDIINSLLQMLDEGMMLDSSGGKVSFRDSIVIATSNAGIQHITEYLQHSQEDNRTQEKTVTDWLIEHRLFAPEFLNRFDELVLFRTLSAEDLVQVVNIQMESINRDLAAKKVSILLTPAAIDWIAQEGYDPKLGARPIRRVMQRYVQNIVAKKLLETPVTGGQSYTLDVEDFEAARE